MVMVFVVIAVLFVRSWPEVVLTAAALVLPSGSFHPSLAAVTPIGHLNPFTVTVLVAGTFYAVTMPGALADGIQAAPGVIGVTTMIVGSVAAIGASQMVALYWVISGGLVLVLISSMLTGRYRESPDKVVGAVAVGGIGSAVSVLLEQALGRHIPWTSGDPTPIDFLVFRPSGLPGNSLLASAALAIVLAIVITSDMTIRVRIVAGAVLISAIAATLTRSALIASSIAVIGFLVYRNRKHRWMTTTRLAVLVFGIPGGALYCWTQFDLVVKRLGGSAWGSDSDAMRTENLNIAWQQFSTHWALGLGFGGFQRYGVGLYGSDHASLATADNMYLTAMAEVGIFGVLVFFLIAIFLNGRRARQARSGASASRLVPLVAVAVLSLFFDSLFHDSVLFLFAVALIAAVPPQIIGMAGSSSAARKVAGVVDPLPDRDGPGVRGRVQHGGEGWPLHD